MPKMDIINQNIPNETLLEALENAKKKKNLYYMLIYTLANTGLRISELVSLKSHNISFPNNTIAVIGKGKVIRTVDIGSQLSESLRFFTLTLQGNERLFPYSRQHAARIIKRFTGYHPHALRHTYTIRLLQKTGNIEYVRRQLGHKRLTTTQVYLQFINFKNESSKLNNLFTG